jgi:hypothetical protein
LRPWPSGCGQAGEESFNREFDKSFSASCVSAAVRSGAPQAKATQLCDCTLAGINEKFSAAEKLTLSNEQAKPIMDQCLEKAVQS